MLVYADLLGVPSFNTADLSKMNRNCNLRINRELKEANSESFSMYLFGWQGFVAFFQFK